MWADDASAMNVVADRVRVPIPSRGTLCMLNKIEYVLNIGRHIGKQQRLLAILHLPVTEASEFRHNTPAATIALALAPK